MGVGARPNSRSVTLESMVKGPAPLVIGVPQLLDGRVEQARRPQRGVRHRREARRRHPVQLGEPGGQLANGERRIGRHQPAASPCPLRGGGGDQGRRHVADRRPAVRDVELRGHKRALAGQQRLGEHEAEDGVGLDVVAGANLGGADLPGLMRGEHVAPHVGPQLQLGLRRGQRRDVGDRPRHRPVAVDVAGACQHRAAGLGRAQQGLVQRRPVGEPLVVRGIRAVVERGGTLGELAEPRRVGRVRGHPLDLRALRAASPPGDHPDLLAAVGKQVGGGGADRAGSDDHVQHVRLPSRRESIALR